MSRRCTEEGLKNKEHCGWRRGYGLRTMLGAPSLPLFCFCGKGGKHRTSTSPVKSVLRGHNLAEIGDTGEAAQNLVDEGEMRAANFFIWIEDHDLVKEGIDDGA